MTTGRKMFLGVAVCAILAIAGVAYESAVWAQEPCSGGWHRHGHAGMRGAFDGGFMAALRQLNLSDAQKQSIRSILATARSSMQPPQQTADTAMQAFESTVPDDPNYPQVVANAIRESQQMAQRRIQRLSDIRTQLYAVLSPDQKTQLPALLATIAADRQQN